MKTNVGGIDKILRITVGLAALAFVLMSDSPARWWGLLGFVPLATGLSGFCPLYPMLGFSTCPARR
jgi:hypothetical protein